MPFIIGRKIEMSQQFNEDGTVVPVTLVKAEPNIVTQVRTQEKDGYTAVQLGVDNAKKLNKAEQGHLHDLVPVKTLREFRVDETELVRGEKISVEDFTPGMRVSIVGFSKGRGFAGVVKRHGFKGQKATHGTKDQIRMPGSIGSQRQGKVIKGQRMAGRMGGDRVTVKNLEIVSTDPTTNIIAIKGAVPGARGSLVYIKSTEHETIWQA